MNFIETRRFEKAYKALPTEVKERVKETLIKLSKDIRYPSLQVKKIKGTQGIWEARVSLDYRMTFEMAKNYIILRNVGHHDSALNNP